MCWAPCPQDRPQKAIDIYWWHLHTWIHLGASHCMNNAPCVPVCEHTHVRTRTPSICFCKLLSFNRRKNKLYVPSCLLTCTFCGWILLFMRVGEMAFTQNCSTARGFTFECRNSLVLLSNSVNLFCVWSVNCSVWFAQCINSMWWFHCAIGVVLYCVESSICCFVVTNTRQ